MAGFSRFMRESAVCAQYFRTFVSIVQAKLAKNKPGREHLPIAKRQQ
jgi:hypothetical protein